VGYKYPVRTRLGWLGPVIVVIGLVVGTLGVWWMFHARPEPGPVIDVLAIDAEWAVIVRKEASSDRAFVELISTRRGVEWQALVPRYAGRPGAPGLAAGKAAISVRLARTRPEVWAMSTRDATKLGSVALDEYAVGKWVADGGSDVVTAGDGTRSFEVVDGTGGAAIIAIDLDRGRVLWHHPFANREIAAITPTERAVFVTTRPMGAGSPSGPPVALDPVTGAELAPEFSQPVEGPLVPAGYAWPTDARSPMRNHRAGQYLWLIRPDRLEVLDTGTRRIVATHSVR
jgi:hypothetical protein